MGTQKDVRTVGDIFLTLLRGVRARVVGDRIIGCVKGKSIQYVHAVCAIVHKNFQSDDIAARSVSICSVNCRLVEAHG